MALDIPRGSFVALSYATIDSDCRCLALANAGQLAPLLRKPDGSIEYLQPEGPAFPLGIAPAIAYVALEITLDHGDTLVFYTDGVVEARREGELYGTERLDELLARHRELPPGEIARLVTEDARSYAGGELSDDLAVVVIQHRA
jgi:serine phosphatase RsbU (regulator of sigma subunit)